MKLGRTERIPHGLPKRIEEPGKLKKGTEEEDPAVPPAPDAATMEFSDKGRELAEELERKKKQKREEGEDEDLIA